MIISVKTTNDYTTVSLKFPNGEFIKLLQTTLTELEKDKNSKYKVKENAQDK